MAFLVLSPNVTVDSAPRLWYGNNDATYGVCVANVYDCFTVNEDNVYQNTNLNEGTMENVIE